MNSKERADLVKKYQTLIQNDKLKKFKRRKDENLKTEYDKLVTDINKLERVLECLYDKKLALQDIIRERATQ